MDPALPQEHQSNNTPPIVPTCKGPRRLAFRIRRRGFTFDGVPSLLIVNCFGVWSVGHRRYIRRTRYYRYYALRQDIEPVRARHAALVRKLGVAVHRWPEYVKEVWPLRRRLGDLYWSLWPKKRKERVALRYRQRRQLRQRQRRLVWYTDLFITCMAMLALLLLVMLMGRYNHETNVCMVLASLAAAYYTLLHMA